MIVMGVDGALGTTGIAVLEDKTVKALTKIRTAKVKATPTESARLKQIADEFSIILKHYQPDVVIMENQYVGANPKTSMGLSRVRGVIQLICAMNNIPFSTLEASEIKKITTGKGNAGKELVQNSIVELYKDQDIVQSTLSTIITSGKNKTDDMADALAIAHTYATTPENAISA